MENSKKYLCIKVIDNFGNIIKPLSKCPANPEMVMAALQFITDNLSIQISVQDKPINFEQSSDSVEVDA